MRNKKRCDTCQKSLRPQQNYYCKGREDFRQVSQSLVVSLNNYQIEAATAASKISSATSTFSFVKISGGDQRIVEVPQPKIIRPRLKHAISILSRSSGAAFIVSLSSTNSTPTIKPKPRTSPMQSYLFIKSFSELCR